MGGSMPIYFIRTPVREPFIFDSIGNHWEQEHVIRPNGYPHYHYLQTEAGEGAVRVQGKTIRLSKEEACCVLSVSTFAYLTLIEWDSGLILLRVFYEIINSKSVSSCNSCNIQSCLHTAFYLK